MNAILEQINSIGKGFVEFAWPMLVQSSVLIVILLLVDFGLRKRVRAVFRYCIWMLVLVKLVLPSSLSSPLSFGYLFGDSLGNVTVSNMTRTAEPVEMLLPMEMAGEGEARSVEAISMAPIAAPTTGGIEPAVEAAGLPAVSMAQVTWQGVVFLVWLVVVGAMALLLLQRALFVRGLVAQARNVNSLMNDAFRYCCGQMGMKRKVGLKVSANATSPAVCGLFRPVILVPQNLGPSLGSSHLRTVLLHELAHIKRRDLWVNLAQTVLQIIYFYNPLLWLANAVIRGVREQAVDETVQVAMGERAQQYPETLVNVAKLAFRRPALSLRLIGVVESESALKGRIKRMLSRPIPRSAKLGILGLTAVLIFGAVLIPMAAFTPGAPGLVIKGLVKDAQTGEPIAGAKVGDIDEYADGRQWTITDSNGNYSYLTWYEEHGIKAEAPGYEIQHKGLYTKLFGSEKEKVLDFQLTPESILEQSKFKKTLSNGVEVELVGVCDWTNGEVRKWRPDGIPLNQDIYLEKAHFEKWDDNFGFFAKFTGPEDMSTKWLGISGAVHSSSTYPIFDRQGDKLKDYEGATGKIVDGRVSTSIRFGGATGQWSTIAEFDGKRKISGENDVVFSSPIVSKNGTVIAVRGEWVFDGVRRIIATDTQGRDHKGGWSGRSSSEHTLATTEFRNLSPQQIQSYKVQFRPYECVEFKNVSLRPGVKSDVVVESALLEKEGKDRKGEITAKLVALDEQRERVQRDLDYAERALQEVRAASGRTDLEERSYPHPITSRLIRLEQERDNCHLAIAQLRANIKNLDKRGAAEELKNAVDNLAILEGKLEALDKMIEEAKEQKRDYDIARVEYKRRLAIRDERQRMLGSLKAQIEKWRMRYDEFEASEERLEVEGVGDKYNLMARGGKGRVEALDPNAANLIRRYLRALEKSDWKTALSMCSISVMDKAQQYPTPESFFNTVVPVKEILNKLHDPTIGYWLLPPKHFAYVFDVGISRPDMPRNVSWQWKARKLEGRANWEIDFPAISFENWLAKEKQVIIRAVKEKELLIKELAPRLKGVRTLLTAKREEFVVGEPIYFRLQLINQGDSILSYDCQQVAVNNSMTIEGPDGKEVKYTAEGVQTKGWPVPIKPGETKTLFDQFDITKQYDMRQQGQYRVQFNGNGLSFVVGKEDIFDLSDPKSWRNYRGILPSNVVTIAIHSGIKQETLDKKKV